jgi:hypothetical protein
MSRSTISKGPLGLDICTERICHYVLLSIYLSSFNLGGGITAATTTTTTSAARAMEYSS